MTNDFETTFICSCCEEEYPIEDRLFVNTSPICPSCAEEETVICAHCGERIWEQDNAGDNLTPLCQSCFDNHYVRCYDCDRIIHTNDAYYLDDDDDPYCYSCASNHRRNSAIHEYSYKPEPIFHGTGDRYFGVELEIDDGGEDQSNARELLRLVNREADEFIYCKSDGSLVEGFEIVSHPFTLDFHINAFPWQKILASAVDLGYQSHNSETSGLHIHVNRNTFGDTEEIQDVSIARILYFMESFWNEMLKFSRRTEYQMNRWAARYGYKEHPADILDHAKKGYGGGRYSCVNLQNRNTIEFRLFRGTLKYNTFIATLQMVNHICDVAFSSSDAEIKRLSWCEFVANIPAEEYPELIQYLKERRLYINEMIETEAEI